MQVEYICHSGSDLLCVNAARVSFDKQHSEFLENDERLLSYLVKHNHISPFFHPSITLRITVPIFIANQLKRHTVGFAINEVSRRYVDTTPQFYFPDKLGMRAIDKKQGSDNTRELTKEEQNNIQQYYQAGLVLYETLLAANVAPEDARIVLPLATYTSFYWTGSLYAYARMYKLRSSSDTQRQTREVAKLISNIIEPLFPISWRLLTDAQESILG